MAAQLRSFVAIALVALFAAAGPAAAQQPSVSGLWQKIDQETGKTVIWFLFFQDNSGFYEGVAAKLFPRPSDGPTPPICTNCRDARRNQPLLGLPIITGMQRKGLHYENGNILDPRDGNVYNAMMTVSPDGQQLTVRGYLGISLLGRNEIWYRLPDDKVRQLDPVILAKFFPNYLRRQGRAPLRHPESVARSLSPLH